MLNRYAIARAKSREHFHRVFEEDKDLLDGFGLGLLSVDSTIRVVEKKKLRGDKINAWDVTEIGPSTWEWLQPLLVELKERRDGIFEPPVKVSAVRVGTGVLYAK